MIFLTLYTAIEAASSGGGRRLTHAEQMAELDRQIEEEGRLEAAIRAGNVGALGRSVERVTGVAYQPYGGEAMRPPERIAPRTPQAAPVAPPSATYPGYPPVPAQPQARRSGVGNPEPLLEYQPRSPARQQGEESALPLTEETLTEEQQQAALEREQRLKERRRARQHMTRGSLASPQERLALEESYRALRSQELTVDSAIREKIQELSPIIEKLFYMKDMKQESPDNSIIDDLHAALVLSQEHAQNLLRKMEEEKPQLVKDFLPLISGEGRSLAKSQIAEFESAFSAYRNILNQVQQSSGIVLSEIEKLMEDPVVRPLKVRFRQERHRLASPREIGAGLEGGKFAQEARRLAQEELILAEGAVHRAKMKVERLGRQRLLVANQTINTRSPTRAEMAGAQAELARAQAELARAREAISTSR